MFKFILRLFPQLTKEKENVLIEARQKAKELIFQGQEEVVKLRHRAEEDLSNLSRQVASLEKQIAKEEGKLEQERRDLSQQKNQLDKTREELELEKKQLEAKKQELLKKFEKLAQLTPDEARANLMSFWEQKMKADIANKFETEAEIKKTAEDKSRELLVEAMRMG